MTFPNRILVIILLFAIPQWLVSQTLAVIKKEADKVFVEEQYSHSLVYAQEVLKMEPENLKYHFQAAKSAFEVRAYPISLRHLNVLVENDSANLYPSTQLLLAENYFTLGRYEEAIEAAYNMADNPKGIIFEKERAKRIIEMCEWTTAQVLNTNPDIEIVNLEALNSFDSDFPVSFSNNNLQYATYGKTTKSSKKWCNCDSPCNFEVSWSKHDFSNNAKDTINFPGVKEMLNHFTYSGSNHRIYYSEYTCTDEGSFSSIYFREQSGSGWGPAIKLPDNINKVGYSSKQPYLVSNFSELGDRLFFVSDMPGPYKGWDIWYTDIKNGQFSRPQNFEAINTVDDEITPFFHVPSQTFYFSSNGLPSQGGFDIYKIRYTDQTWCTFEFLPAPINSSFEDSYFILNETGEQAYFSSNRAGTKFDDPDYMYCCPDIFRASIPQDPNLLDIIVRPYHKITLEPLSDVYTRFLDITDPENPSSMGQPDEMNGTELVFKGVPFNKFFKAYGEKPGFLPDSNNVNSAYEACDQPPTLKYVNLYLAPKINLIVSVYDKITSEPFVEGATVDLMDDATGNVIASKNIADEGGYRFFFELEYDKDYRIRTYKSGAPEYLAFSEFKKIDSRVTKITQTIEEDLQLFRPLPLFFHHAEPRRLLPVSKVVEDTLVETNLDYSDFYESYVSTSSVNNYSKQIFDRNVTRDNRRNEVEAFFKEVEEGKKRLDTLAITIIKRLEEGEYDRVKLQVSGFASPVGDSLSNMALSQRRSNSMEKYLKYIFGREGKLNLVDKLEVELSPFGDRQARGKFSCDSPNITNKRACEKFSIPASKERRVEITNIEFQKQPINRDDE